MPLAPQTALRCPSLTVMEKSLDYMAGHIVIRAKSKKRPGLIDETKEIISETELSGGSRVV